MDVRRIEEEVDPDFLSDAHSRTGPAESGDSCESKISRMRELVVKYKAEKVCHEEMVKMPLVDLKVLEVYTKSKKEHESHLKMNLELLKKEKCHVKPNKGCYCEAKYHLGKDTDVLFDAWSGTAEIRESKMIGLELEQETTKVVVIKERLKKAKDRQEGELIVEMKLLGFSVGDHVMMKVSPWKGVVCFGKKCELAPRVRVYVSLLHFLEFGGGGNSWREEELVSSSTPLGERDVDAVGDLVFMSSWVKSTNNCFGGMMLIFGFLEALEMEALVNAMDVDNG
ncbi:hypothetical protein Tco_0490251 [Tanacetum coccineum]